MVTLPRSMHAKLDEVLDSAWNCLKEVDTEAILEVALCGNGKFTDKQRMDQHYDIYIRFYCLIVIFLKMFTSIDN